jgi:hypothetical protein
MIIKHKAILAKNIKYSIYDNKKNNYITFYKVAIKLKIIDFICYFNDSSNLNSIDLTSNFQ